MMFRRMRYGALASAGLGDGNPRAGIVTIPDVTNRGSVYAAIDESGCVTKRTLHRKVWADAVCIVALIATTAGTGPGSHLVNVGSLSQHLYEFAVELCRLACTMPGGYEDPLIHLSERMIRMAREQAADLQS